MGPLRLEPEHIAIDQFICREDATAKCDVRFASTYGPSCDALPIRGKADIAPDTNRIKYVF
jgi:hypothetical protein